jgi:hypothetical protein
MITTNHYHCNFHILNFFYTWNIFSYSMYKKRRGVQNLGTFLVLSSIETTLYFTDYPILIKPASTETCWETVLNVWKTKLLLWKSSYSLQFAIANILSGRTTHSFLLVREPSCGCCFLLTACHCYLSKNCLWLPVNLQSERYLNFPPLALANPIFMYN